MDTLEQANSIRILHCKYHYDGRYILNRWEGNVEDIMTLADTLGLD